ncbi:hypothetical protein BU17DRAFT_67613 [Hysterangium stoloniferum]|nr:hypothetical protein BU17DRAFT_67613 [Hysterangium stoloniferum]
MSLQIIPPTLLITSNTFGTSLLYVNVKLFSSEQQGETGETIPTVYARCMYGILYARPRTGAITLPVASLRRYVTDTSQAFTTDATSKKRKKRLKTVNPKDNDEKVQKRAQEQAVQAEMRRRALATLDKSASIQGNPTLGDLDQLKPDKPHVYLEFIEPGPFTPSKSTIPGSGIIKQHAAAFEKLVDTLITRFSRKQLLALHQDGVQTSAGIKQKGTHMKRKTVRDIAGEIIRWRWHWPYPTEVENRKSFLTTKVEKSFQMTTSEFFLLLGPDGSSLRELAENYEIVIKGVKRKSNNVFTLVVDGHGYGLDCFADIVAERKRLIISENLQLGDAGLSSHPNVLKNVIFQPDLIRRISKQSNALVIDLGKSKFQISAHHTRHIMLAKRLVLRAFQQMCLSPPSLAISLLAAKTLDRENNLSYSLFPFELNSSEKIPLYWIPTSSLTEAQPNRAPSSLALSRYSFGRPTFYRVKKIEDWLAQSAPSSMSDRGRTRSKIIGSMGEPRVLREALGLTHSHSLHDERRQIHLTASLFVVIIPSYLTNSSPMSRTILTRLVYRSNPGTVQPGYPVATLKFELTPTKVELSSLGSDMRQLSHDTTFTTQDESHNDNSPKQGEDLFRWSSVSSSVKLWEGMETSINLMLPSRPMDIQLTSFDYMRIPLDSAPKELLDYAQSLDLRSRRAETVARPIPPMQVGFNGKTYVLDLDATIKMSSHVLDGKDISMNEPVAVMVENAVELESNEHIRSCLNQQQIIIWTSS